MLCGGLLNDCRTVGVSWLGVSRPLGVEDLDQLESFSIDLVSTRSLYDCGVDGLDFSGDFGGLIDEPPSIMLLKSLTVPVWRDCIRLCAAPLIRERSGEVSMRFAALLINAFSLAFSVRAACADCIAVDVLGREARLGDDGFIGSGGGARSGSELSHLVWS
jgi:hypothetical protein